ncbi:MAG TPA: DUF5671 domain-containing protein [Candidatus Paceibacterota bacterium]
MKLTPKDFFLNVAVMATLYVSAFSLITLLFQYIDTVFPREIGGYRDPYGSGISFAIASLIIVFPLYVFFTRLLNQDIRKNPEKRDLGIRRWLIYITLFVAGAAVAIDLIILLNTFLSGQELTVGFMLKVVTIVVVIGGIFAYYFLDLKRKWETEIGLSKTIGGAVTLLVFAAVVGGFFILGSPQANRLLRIDAEKIGGLQSIQWQMVSFWQQKERLPENLAELEDPLVGFILPNDPQTGASYEYQATGARSFELCAVFNRESRNLEVPLARPALPDTSVIYPGFDEANWEHGVGRVCFERTIDPERFPPFKERL